METISEELSSSKNTEIEPQIENHIEIPETDLATEHSTIIPFNDEKEIDRESTTHVSETDMSLANEPDISSCVETDQASFNAYTEELVKESRWKRLSDQVEMLHNSSTDDSFRDAISPQKKLKSSRTREKSPTSNKEDSADSDNAIKNVLFPLADITNTTSQVNEQATKKISVGILNSPKDNSEALKTTETADTVTNSEAAKEQTEQENLEVGEDIMAAKIYDRRCSDKSIRFENSRMLNDDSKHELDSDSDFELEPHDIAVFSKVEAPFDYVVYWDALFRAQGVATLAENGPEHANESIKRFLLSSCNLVDKFNPELECGKKFAEF